MLGSMAVVLRWASARSGLVLDAAAAAPATSHNFRAPRLDQS